MSLEKSSPEEQLEVNGTSKEALTNFRDFLYTINSVTLNEEVLLQLLHYFIELESQFGSATLQIALEYWETHSLSLDTFNSKNIRAINKKLITQIGLDKLTQFSALFNKIDLVQATDIDLTRTLQQLISPHIKEISISHNGLEEIPSPVFSYPNLEILNISDNQITTIASDIIQLQKLKLIFLSNNPISQLPQANDSMESLRAGSIVTNSTNIPLQTPGIQQTNKLRSNYLR